MVNIREEIKALAHNFNNIAKTIERKNASKRPVKIKIREYLIIRYWNDILRSISLYEQEAEFDAGFGAHYMVTCHQKLKDCLKTLKSKAQVKGLSDFVQDPQISAHERSAIAKILDGSVTEIPETVIDQTINDLDVDQIHNSPDNNTKMVQSAEDFFKLASKVVDTKFDGKPSNLEAFIEQIELLEPMVEETNKKHLIKFVCTHLTGKAREALPDNPQTVKAIIDALRKEIKPESSRVIEGKIVALRADKMNVSKFAEKANELAEDFRQSLVFEGHTKEKANEMAIRKTVELCYKSTRSDTVKAILEAAPFDRPSEVIAKYVVQQNVVQQERTLTQNAKNNGSGSGSGGQNRKFNRKFRNNRNNANGSNPNSNTNYNQNRGNQNRNGGNNGRNFRNNRSSRGGYNNQQNGNRQEQILRIVSGSENQPGPSQEGRAPADNPIRFTL